MPPMKHIIITTTLLILNPLPSKANGFETHEMMRYCRLVVETVKGDRSPLNHESTIQFGMCVGAVLSVENLLSNACVDRRAGFQTTMGLAANVNNQITAGQLAQVFIKYAEDHPKTWSYNAGETIALALNEAFPCR